MANRFLVIIHYLFVFVAMLGFLLIQFKKSPGFTLMGFVFFAVFSFTEIFRQMFVLFYLNNLRFPVNLIIFSASNSVCSSN